MKYLSFFAVLAFITLFSVRPVLAEEANAPTNMPVGDYVQEATPSKPGVNGKRFVPPGIDAIRQGGQVTGTRLRTIPPFRDLKTTAGMMRKENASERATLRKEQNSAITQLMEEYRKESATLNEAYRQELKVAVQAGKTKEEIDTIRKDYLAKRKALQSDMNANRKNLTTTNMQNRKNLKEETKAERKNFFESIQDWWKSLTNPKPTPAK
jgi:uncharacterized protein YecT (DUF1311 family)